MPSSAEVSTVTVGQVSFNVRTSAAAAKEVVDLARSREAVSIRLSNAWCVVLAERDRAYADLLNARGLTYADGKPVDWAIRRHTTAPSEQVRGPKLFNDVLNSGREYDLSHFFLGATQETLEALVETARDRYPGINVAGLHAPPFGPLDAGFYEQSISEVERCDPDIVWIGMGAPKQDFAAFQLARSVQRPCVGIGAAFDFMAGTAREAPRLVQRVGLEWLFRLASEPRRLWRRYLVGNVRFLVFLLRGSQ